MSLCCGTSDQQMLMKGEDEAEATGVAVVQLPLPKGILLLTFSDWSVWLQTCLSLTAVIYVWLLPWLQTTAWAHTCQPETVEGEVWEYPHCAYLIDWSWVRKILEFLHFNTWFEAGASVSDYIANAQATGGMAACEFWPCMFLYLPNRWVDSPGAYISLIIFQVFFGLFLMNPVTSGLCMHTLVVGIFCNAGLAHMFIMGFHLDRLPSWRARACKIFRVGAILGFARVIFTGMVCLISSWIGANAPFFFWFCESLGLSSMSLFVICFRYEDVSQLPH